MFAAFVSTSALVLRVIYAVYMSDAAWVTSALQEFHKYLISAKHPFVIFTDHANL